MQICSCVLTCSSYATVFTFSSEFFFRYFDMSFSFWIKLFESSRSMLWISYAIGLTKNVECLHLEPNFCIAANWIVSRHWYVVTRSGWIKSERYQSVSTNYNFIRCEWFHWTVTHNVVDRSSCSLCIRIDQS